MKKFFRVLLGCLVAVGSAQAAIVDKGDYLTDTVSGLDWLDVTITAGMSVNSVKSQLVAGGLYEGWRYATGDEFNSLVGNYTRATISTYGYVNQEPAKIDGLVVMLGSTADVYALSTYGATYDALLGLPEGSGVDYTSGYLADLYSPTSAWIAMLWDFDADPSNFDYSMAHYSDLYVGFSSLSNGSFLVRDNLQIPEPSSILLMLAAGLGVVSTIKNRKPIKRLAV